MSQSAESAIFRVTLKGKFADLTDHAHRYLVEAAPEHTYFKSAYTAEGTFVYDADVKFFSLRYEVRCSGDSEVAAAIATTEAKNFLETMGYDYTKLRSDVVDLAAMWTT